MAPGKKPLSSMSPTVVLYEGRLRAVVGASGGPLIVSSVLQTLARCVQPLQQMNCRLWFPLANRR